MHHEHIRNRAQKLGLKGGDLAALSNLSGSQLSNFFKGRITLDAAKLKELVAVIEDLERLNGLFPVPIGTHDVKLLALAIDRLRDGLFEKYGELTSSTSWIRLRFDSLRPMFAKLPVQNAIIDGEIVCLDLNGVSQFNGLLSSRRAHQAIFYAFDLLWLDDVDLRRKPLLERKAFLSELVHGSNHSQVLYAQHVDGCGKKFFDEICRRDLEGVVAKRKASIYKEDGNGWLKIKNRSYSQAEGRHELLTGRVSER
jgi:transcriptional regulator with XRE-family HTH domain